MSDRAIGLALLLVVAVFAADGRRQKLAAVRLPSAGGFYVIIALSGAPRACAPDGRRFA
ncbi:hypothetical protein [Hydrogenibacillus sp. N12]|uniref:hypothetical protein n=1 Tax=Hydrogenibacillus sp. N12 TaxID=2866627 RepID=UPI001C7DE029|nr:hypothetical protein [Hydrogenibacillus sp. N12]QZA32248.1 hypothetical protein K2M58_07890 [Hydrogenibacillus sp. N12]